MNDHGAHFALYQNLVCGHFRRHPYESIPSVLSLYEEEERGNRLFTILQSQGDSCILCSDMTSEPAIIYEYFRAGEIC